MEGVKGVCVLCNKHTLVLLPHQSSHIISKLFGLLENQINVQKYKPARCEIRACYSCLYEIEAMDKLKGNISLDACQIDDVCSLCKAKDKILLSLDNFQELVEKVSVHKISQTKCIFCLQCVMYFTWLNRIRDNLFEKYSCLKLSSYKTKSRESIARQVGHLKPLKSLDLQVNISEEDAKLWAKVPYVKLDVCKLKPKLNKKAKILKIKLGQNFKKVSSKKAKATRKELVVNLVKLKPEATTVIEKVELVAESNLPQQTAVICSDDEWSDGLDFDGPNQLCETYSRK